METPTPQAEKKPRRQRSKLSAADELRLRRLLIERANRSIEGLRIYEPLPEAERFHACMAKERIVWGSNRSTKTTAVSAEIARALTGQDPHGKWPERDGIFYLVAKDQKEMANVFWKKLAKPGAFKMIRDLQTGRWRVFRPRDPADAARIKEVRPAPPLLPKRFIADIAWEDKKMGLPKTVYLTTGWELHCFTGNAKPQRGTDIDGAAFDEEIPEKGWYTEVAARLVDRNGRFIWGATPQEGTDVLLELHERAEHEMGRNPDNPAIAEFHTLIHDNIYLTPEQIEEFASKLSEDEYRVRIEGEFAITASIIFPEWRNSIHVVPYFQIPTKWTRYAAIDPGYQICAVLFMAIPPDEDKEHGEYAYLYDELYLANCDATTFAQGMYYKCADQVIETFLIDEHESRKHTHTGSTTEELYAQALRAVKLACHTHGYGFAYGSDNPQADVEAIRLWLRSRPGKGPKLRVLEEKCPNFIWEMKHWKWKREGPAGQRRITNKPEERGRVHSMACLRYLVQHDPQWVTPRGSLREGFMEKYLANKRRKKQENAPLVMLGPGITV